jgi:uncharacterized protein (DUF1501 family)
VGGRRHPLGTDGNGRIYGSADVGAAMQRIVGGHARHACVRSATWRPSHGAPSTPKLALRTALKPPSDGLFGTAPASGSYNANNDPKLRYDNPLTGAQAFNGAGAAAAGRGPHDRRRQRRRRAARRQVFFVSLGGFDTHDKQNRNQADLMARLAHALRYFDTTLGGPGRAQPVTTFTASDFGRTFTSNGDGTDHGWGAHHFVMGGAVRGGDLYGNFPVLGAKNANNNNFDSSPNQLGNGCAAAGRPRSTSSAPRWAAGSA